MSILVDLPFAIANAADRVFPASLPKSEIEEYKLFVVPAGMNPKEV